MRHSKKTPALILCFLTISGHSPAVAKTATTAPKAAQKKSTVSASRDSKSETKSNEKQTVWVIEQSNAQLGTMTVYAAPNAVKIKVGVTGGNVIAKAPDWKIVGYNTNDRVVFETSYDNFQRQELPSLIATTDYFEGRKLKPVSVYYQNWPALRVSAPTPEGTVGMMMPTWSGVGNSAGRAKATEVFVFATETSPVSPKIISILKAIYRIPRFGGVPLGVVFKYSDGTIGVTLKTTSIKKDTVSSSIFSVSTKNYKPTKTMENAILSSLMDSAFMETP